jgi:hypothetical protein
MTLPFPTTRIKWFVAISKVNMGHLLLNHVLFRHEVFSKVYQCFKWHVGSNHSPCFNIFTSATRMRYLTLFLPVYEDSFVLQVEGFVFHRFIMVLVQITLLCDLVTERLMDPIVKVKAEFKLVPELRDVF